MTPVTKVAPLPSPETKLATPRLEFDGNSPTPRDAHEFAQALQRHLHTAAPGITPADAGSDKLSLTSRISARASDLAGEIQKDQQYVSKLLEHATATGDQMVMMKAMLALNDYQTRVQFVSKTISKASTSVDQLTRMQ